MENKDLLLTLRKARREQELTEKIAQKLLEYDFDRHGVKYGILADEILALIKQAGYVRLPLFQTGDFILHSGSKSNFKIDCDALLDEDLETIAMLISTKVKFGTVIGVPKGGLRLAQKLEAYITEGKTLIVDDVLTTGNSMEEERKNCPDAIGYVIFARGKCPNWITPLFVLPKEAGYVKLRAGEHISGMGSQKLPDVIGTTLDGQPLIKQAGRE